ncbi:MAG: anaerobic ribonucleoside-triphosphate reductase activating protein [Peptococcaceae bacterium]|nr:MAG: anaerobic ribonucleoside-triphosphate reductase activating protein [Peptococcaceae bacterium]
MVLRIAGVIEESVVDGPGLRFVVFVQGCYHHCPGCQNEDTWDPAGGYAVAAAELLNQIKSVRLIKGVTFSGGEPFLQPAPLAWLGRRVKKLGLDVVTFTGYTWEELLSLAPENRAVKELLEVSDYLVDGPFILSERDLSLPFRGSRNQRIIDLRKGRVMGDGWLK